MVRAYAAVREMTLEQLADQLGITRQTLDNKISGTSDFTLAEARLLGKIFEKDLDDIFLA